MGKQRNSTDMQRLHEFLRCCAPHSPAPPPAAPAATEGSGKMTVMETANVADSKLQAEEGPARRGRGRPPGSGRKPPTGAAANAQKLKALGAAGSFMNTNGLVAALGLNADHRPPATDLQEALKTTRPSAYNGTRLNMLARLGRQASPAVPPPLLPPPWADASEARDWQAIAMHTAQCIQEALRRYPRVELVRDAELNGSLCLNKVEAESSDATVTELQRRCNAADVVILHDDLDALVVAHQVQTGTLPSPTELPTGPSVLAGVLSASPCAPRSALCLPECRHAHGDSQEPALTDGCWFDPTGRSDHTRRPKHAYTPREDWFPRRHLRPTTCGFYVTNGAGVAVSHDEQECLPQPWLLAHRCHERLWHPRRPGER